MSQYHCLLPLLLTLSLLGCSAYAATTHPTAQRLISDANAVIAQAGSRTTWLPSQNMVESIESVTECGLKCNRGKMEEECIGRAEINCLTVSTDDLGTRVVNLYTRTCDGKYTNITTEEDGIYQSSQGCEGYTRLIMKTERQLPANDLWVTDYSFTSTCHSKHINTYMEVVGETNTDMSHQVATFCEGSAGLFDEQKPAMQTHMLSYEEYTVKSKVTCNDVASEWNENCDGLFSAATENGVEKSQIYCDGIWKAYRVNWQCQGVYNYTRTEETSIQKSVLFRQCEGWTTISTAALLKGYQLCTGVNKFDETYTNIPSAT